MRNFRFSSLAYLVTCLAGSTLFFGAAACEDKDNRGVEKKEETVALLEPWPTGKSQSFTFALTSSTSLGAMPATGTVELSGKVVIFAVAAKDGGVRLILQPSDVALLRPQGAGDTAVTQLREDLERPFALEFKRGVIAAYLEPEESSLLAFGLRRQLAVMTQRAQPSGAALNGWTGMEWDASGQAKVSYTPDAKAPGMFAWKKTGYEKVLSNNATHAALKEQSWVPEVVESAGYLHVDDGGVVEVERRESLQTEMTPDQYLRSSYTSKLVRLSAAKSASAPKVEGLIKRNVADPPPKMDTSSLDAIRFAGRSWDEVIGSLSTTPNHSASGGQKEFGTRQAAFHALVGLFRTDEDNVKKAAVLIQKRDPRSSTLLRALASASTAPSLAVLSKVSFDPARSSAERRGAAATLLRSEVPPPAVLDTVIRFVDDPELRETGLLGLGTFSRLWRSSEQNEVAERAAARLQVEFSKAKTEEEKSHCLFAIANSGDARFFDEVWS